MTEESRAGGPVLEVADLAIEFNVGGGWKRTLHDVGYTVSPGEVLAIVGESGSGKTVSSLAILGLLGRNARVTGSVKLNGREILNAPDTRLRSMRAREVSMIFQEPMTALNPVFRVGQQLTEVLRVRGGHTRSSARIRAMELLDLVELPDPKRAFDAYPHQLSGGQRQRAMIALAISCDPSLIFADEPTTALDVTIQREILELLRRLRDKTNSALVLITHDLGVVADTADRIIVMRGGEIVEVGTVAEVFASPAHPYTRQLLAAVPTLGSGGGDHDGTSERPAPVIAIEDAVVEYRTRRRGRFAAVERVSFDIGEGEIVGVVGESGSGKTTLAKAIVGLQAFSGGSVTFAGGDLVGARGRRLREARRRIGFVFQDPGSSLNPRRKVGDSVGEPMRVAGGFSSASIRARVAEVLEAVQLPSDAADRYPHELSGGQRQRVGIARAIIMRPSLLIADEPTSALDVSVQQRVLEIFRGLQREMGFACLFVSHDLAVVDSLSSRIVVMNHGHLVEEGTPDQVIRAPKEEYTRRLVDAIPLPDPQIQRERRERREAQRVLEETG
ncbi:ABC transporter ATP-binding protein [Microbacterium sp. 18062]|uniref:dipeptide ABC transporter ATP-binding protein n=1 Tax=Microbacterium sp. 18062 TaxID=2681410 RepID=UPI00135A538E|nr:ABC transporter ATP-binding protein [Microbacterium sp. 18062]